MYNVIQKLLFGNGKNIYKKGCILNTLAGIMNALQAVILLMLVTRFTDIEDAGVITISFAVSNLLVTIGKFGVRNYQVTDTHNRFSFKSYLKARLFTVLFMLISSILYCLYSFFVLNSSYTKVIIIFLFCLIYTIEALEDVFCGAYQKEERLDVSSIVFLIRWILIVIIFGCVLAVTHNLLYSTILAFLTSLLSSTILIYSSYKRFNLFKIYQDSGNWKLLIKKSFPLFVGAFLMMYLTNSPKYAIERYLSDEIQACYGFVFMPLFVIELLNNFLYQPKLIKIAMSWENNELKSFKKYIIKQSITLTTLTCVCIIGASLIGIPVLSIIYSTNLQAYKSVLLIIIVGSGFLAFAGFFSVLLTVMRKQKLIMYSYIIVAVLAKLLIDPSVSSYGVLGGTVVFAILLVILSIILFSFLLLNYLKKARARFGV